MSIEEIIDRAKEMYKLFDSTRECNASHVGACGLSQCCINYSAKIYGVPQECIKLCKAHSILEGISHAFVILILDKFYLCDLSFKQFICEEDDTDLDKIRLILKESTDKEVEETHNNINELLEKGYTLLTEPTLICFYTFCYRQCDNQPEMKNHKPEISDITLKYNPIYSYKGKINIMQLTVQYNWEHICDFSLKNFLDKNAITPEEYEYLKLSLIEEEEEDQEKSKGPALKRRNAMLRSPPQKHKTE